MAIILRLIFAVFWATSAGFTGFLMYIVLETESNPQSILAWLIMCAFTLLSATWLTYNIVFSYRHEPGLKRHDPHLE
jgi:phosphotransferase system  glucose/maltose/N-acetylglucosamine-specific IIC component